MIEQQTGNGLIISDAVRKTLYRVDSELKAIDSVKTDGPLIDFETGDNGWVSCDVGVLNPNNGKFGSGRNVEWDGKRKLPIVQSPLFGGLSRPVQITCGDLNTDGRKVYRVGEFGYQEGGLSRMENMGNGKNEKHVLRALAGASKAYIEDYNHDGLKDFWVLFAGRGRDFSFYK